MKGTISFLALVGALTTATAAQQVVRTAEDPVLEPCLPSIIDKRHEWHKIDAREARVGCDKAFAAGAATLSEEERFYITIEQAKLAFYGQEYEKSSALVGKAREILAKTENAYNKPRWANIVRTFEIVLQSLNGDNEAAFSAAKAMSDTQPDRYQAHQLYMNLAYVIEDNEAALEATKRKMRLRPSPGDMLSLAVLLGSFGDLEAADSAAIAAIEVADNTHSRSKAFLEYVRIQSRLGHYDQALLVLDMLDGDKDGDLRQNLLQKAFSDNGIIKNRRVFPLRRFDDIKEANKERAIIALQQGDRKKAVAMVEGMYLVCRDIRCLELELAIAEEKDRANEADRLRRKIDRANFVVSRRHGEWEKNALAQIAVPPRERFLGGVADFDPEFDAEKSKHGVYRIELTTEAPLSRDQLEEEIMVFAREYLAKQDFDAFKVLDLEERYRMRTKGGVKSFVEHNWRLELVPFKNAEAVPASQQWRLISTSRQAAD